VIRALLVAVVAAALLTGCSQGVSSPSSDVTAGVSAGTGDTQWATFETAVVSFDAVLARYPEEVSKCLSTKAAVESCMKHCFKHSHLLDYDNFNRRVSGWLQRPQLSIACQAKALDVASALVQRYAMLATAAGNVDLGPAAVSNWVDSANVFAEHEAQALDKAEKLCGLQPAPT